MINGVKYMATSDVIVSPIYSCLIFNCLTNNFFVVYALVIYLPSSCPTKGDGKCDNITYIHNITLHAYIT